MFGQIPQTDFDLRFSVLGIPVRVHPIFWVTSLFLAWTDRLEFVFVRVLCIFVAILVHELGHAIVTRVFGWQPEIVLYILGGYATTTRHSTWRDIAVSAAGPAAGFVLYAGFVAAAIFTPDDVLRQNPVLYDAINFSLFINLVWNLANLVPVLPLDGGQISRELCTWFSPRRGMRVSLIISMAAAGGIALLALQARMRGEGLFGLEPLFLALMFGYLAFESWQAYQQLRYRG